MWNIFNSKKNNATSSSSSGSGGHTDLLARAESYFSKMEERSKEIHLEARESAQLIADSDTDPYKRNYHQFKAAILAQFTSIIQTGMNTYQTEILPKASMRETMELGQRFAKWQTGIVGLMDSAFKDILERDLEKEYQQIMQEYHNNAKDLTCSQCGDKLDVDKFYFTATYLPCPSCGTQNTFDPGSKVRMVEHMARPLAESRCREQYETYRQKKAEVGQRGALEEYKSYVTAMIAQMDEILPGLQEQHRNFQQRLLDDYNRFFIPW